MSRFISAWLVMAESVTVSDLQTALVTAVTTVFSNLKSPQLPAASGQSSSRAGQLEEEDCDFNQPLPKRFSTELFFLNYLVIKC